jgi:hypothetical protein
MEIRKTKLGPDHPDTLTSMNNLAFTWKNQGKNTKALDFMRDCSQIGPRISGFNHPKIISSLRTVGDWEKEQQEDYQPDKGWIVSQSI